MIFLNAHLNSMNINDKSLIQAARSIKPNPPTRSPNPFNFADKTDINSSPNFKSNLNNQNIFNNKNFSAGLSALPPSQQSSVANPSYHNQYHQPAPAYQPPAPPAYSHPQPPTPSYNPYLHSSNASKPIVQPPSVNKYNPSRNSTRHAKGSAMLSNVNSSSKIPACAMCLQLIRGPFIFAVGKEWCPNHFVCAHPQCGINLQDIGFVEENGKLYCERDYEKFFAPSCNKCQTTILGVCLKVYWFYFATFNTNMFYFILKGMC